MISSWKLSRFKSVYDETELKFAPLTLFSGVNNSGKSTIIQSILLTSQTLASPVRKRAVSLNDNLVRLGTFDDIVSNGHEGESVDIGFKLTHINPSELLETIGSNRSGFIYRLGHTSDVRHIEAAFSFSARTSGESDRREIVQLQPLLQSSRLGLSYRGEEGKTIDAGVFEFRRRTESIKEVVDRMRLVGYEQSDLSELGFEVTRMPHDHKPAYQPYHSEGTIIGAYLDHFVPRALLAKYDHVEEESKQIVGAFLNRSEYTSRGTVSEEVFLKLPDRFKEIVYDACNDASRASSEMVFVRDRVSMSLEHFKQSFTPVAFRRFADSLMLKDRTAMIQNLTENSLTLENIARAGKPSEFRTRFQSMPARFDFAAEYITAYFQSSVKYLAPLRDEPKPVYPLAASSDPTDVGLHGEHTAAVLELNSAEVIEYIPSKYFSLEHAGREFGKATLATAVLDWMHYMGVVTDIKTIDLGNRGHELKVATGSQKNLRYLTHVGVGVSQVLPIVVLCLLSPRGSILIFEQPELHLHPRVQSRLADFFLSMTFLGKQCIVETHSEHLINRLRQRTATALGDEISSQVMMYFVEAESGRSKYLPIPISPYGTIKNWPKGFFDEGEELARAILQAGMNKRKAEAEAK